MSDQSLREAQLRQEFRAEIMRGYQAALCNSDVPGWTLGDEVAKVADNLLAAHRAEPAPVVTDEAVEAAAMAVSLDWEKYTASMRTALKAAAPLLGPRPLLDGDEVSSWIVEAAVQFAGSSGSADACHDAVKPAVDGVMTLARPMPTREQIDKLLRRHTVGAFNPEQSACSCDRTWRTHADHREHLRDALLALLNGAES